MSPPPPLIPQVTVSSADGTIESMDGLADDLFGLDQATAAGCSIEEYLLWMDGAGAKARMPFSFLTTPFI